MLEDPWDAARAAREAVTHEPKSDLDGGTHTLALVIERERIPIGDVLLWRTDTHPRIADVGWVLDPAHAGRGFAREAVAEVLRGHSNTTACAAWSRSWMPATPPPPGSRPPWGYATKPTCVRTGGTRASGRTRSSSGCPPRTAAPGHPGHAGARRRAETFTGRSPRGLRTLVGSAAAHPPPTRAGQTEEYRHAPITRPCGRDHRGVRPIHRGTGRGRGAGGEHRLRRPGPHGRARPLSRTGHPPARG
ncbi:GNAT family N-acetyltransferase [Kocuria indica]|nr:GNAT family N-acetyltransferase [Kocuria indica]MBN6843522.1 GNAT family N-acetyltransferase [Kocuria indica]